jgi:hypothetical protein
MNNKSLDECINFCLDKSIDKTDREMYLNIVKYLMSCKDVNWSYGYGQEINKFLTAGGVNKCDSIVNYNSDMSTR